MTYSVQKQIPAIDENGDCYGYRNISVELKVEHVKGLVEELNKLKEYISYGKYSAK